MSEKTGERKIMAINCHNTHKHIERVNWKLECFFCSLSNSLWTAIPNYWSKIEKQAENMCVERKKHMYSNLKISNYIILFKKLHFDLYIFRSKHIVHFTGASCTLVYVFAQILATSFSLSRFLFSAFLFNLYFCANRLHCDLLV